MLLGDTADVVNAWSVVIGAGFVTGVGGAVLALYFLFRTKKREADGADQEQSIELARKAFEASKAETDAIAAADKARRDEAIEALTRIIEDLREQVERQSQRYSRLQASITDRLEAAGQERDQLRTQLHDCEKRHAVLEEQQKRTAADVVRLTEEIRSLKGKP